MAELEPQFLEAPASISGLELRSAFLPATEGIVDAGNFAVTPGAGLTVDVAAGSALVQGDAVPDQGLYRCRNDAVRNSSAFELGGIGANAGANPRVDLLVARVYDTTHDGLGLRKWRFEIIAGTASAGATLANLTGAPAVPASALPVAFILVPGSNPAVIPAANIGGYKDPTTPASGAVAGAPPKYAFGRPRAYVPAVHANVVADVSVNTATDTLLAMGAEQHDNDGMHDNVTNNSRLTCRTPGLWKAWVSAEWVMNANRMQSIIRKNGVTPYLFLAGAAAASAFNNALAVSTPGFRLGYGDYIEGIVNHVNGVATTMSATGHTRTGAGADWLGP